MLNLSFLSICLTILGYANQARKCSDEAIAEAQESSYNDYAMTVAVGMTCFMHQLERSHEDVDRQAEALLVLSARNGFPVWTNIGQMFHGWVLGETGQVKAGIDALCQGIITKDTINSLWMQPYFLGLLAETEVKAGYDKEARNHLDEALRLIGRTGERWYEAELHHLRAALEPDPRAAELRFQRATM